MKVLGIIPARYASTRLPGKPLVDINGKTMIRHVYERVKQVFDFVIVATDDVRITDEVEGFGGNWVITSENHQSGTDRCAEAVAIYEKQTGENFDVVINIQGDEPFIKIEQLQQVISCFEEFGTEIATLIKRIDDLDDVFNTNKPKVVINKDKEAIYFSRSPIPYIRNFDKENWLENHTFYKHIGIYGYRKDILLKITKLKQSALEIAESLEQNRWIENSYKIKTEITEHESISIDTFDDLSKIINI